MVTNRASRRDNRTRVRVGGGFTLIDLLVSMSIIAVLISLLLPSLNGVRETTRRVVCASHQRQLGLGLAMYFDDQGEFPASKAIPKDTGPASYQLTNIARRDGIVDTWDGLGLLYIREYINAPQVYYCPSHHGQNPLSVQLPKWSDLVGKIVTNYQYRGPRLPLDQGDRVSLLTDGLASRDEYSHNVGSNVLRADFSVGWIPDVGGDVFKALPVYGDSDVQAALKVGGAWQKIDSAKPGK